MKDLVSRLSTPIHQRLDVSKTGWSNSVDQAITAMESDMAEAADKIEGLQADFDSAVETAFKRGATEWCRLNYPDQFRRLSGG